MCFWSHSYILCFVHIFVYFFHRSSGFVVDELAEFSLRLNKAEGTAVRLIDNNNNNSNSNDNDNGFDFVGISVTQVKEMGVEGKVGKGSRIREARKGTNVF